MIKNFLKSLLRQKGQMMALYALLIPVLFAAGGAGVEIGWYYMNVSRLHNMADSAIIASAKVLTKTDGEFSNYRYNYFLPRAPENLTPEDRNSASGDLEAKKYISKNLEISNEWSYGNVVADTFSDVDLTFKKETFPTKDADGYPILYYEITLTETPNHFFDFFNSFGDMQIVATAAAKFTQVPDGGGTGGGGGTVEHGPSLYDQMEDIKKNKVYDYWEVIQHEYEVELENLQTDMKNEIANGADKAEVLQRYIDQLTAKYMERGVDKNTAISRAKADLDEKVSNRKSRSANKARERSVTTSGNYWLKDLTSYRTENMSLNGQGGTSWSEKQNDFDDLFINAIQDLSFHFKTDWDITEPLPSGFKVPDNFLQGNCGIFDGDTKITAPATLQDLDPSNVRFFYRVLALIGVEEDKDKPKKKIFPYKVRAGRDIPDPLYARIESDPIKWEEHYTSYTSWNSVRQFFINVNCTNSKDEDRPLIFFYDGPRKIDENSHVRDSKPIILTLNADFRGVLYAPNSPVVVVGNGNKFTGFIVAKKFLKLKTEAEFKAEGLKKVVRKDNSHDIYVAEENIKSSETETLPEHSIAVTYDKGESGKFYYLELNGEHFEKISQVKTDSSRYSPIKIPEMFVNQIGDVQFSNEVFATMPGTDKAGDAETADDIYDKDVFGLSSSTFDNFFIVKFANYKYLNRSGSLDNFFTTERSKQVD